MRIKTLRRFSLALALTMVVNIVSPGIMGGVGEAIAEGWTTIGTKTSGTVSILAMCYDNGSGLQYFHNIDTTSSSVSSAYTSDYSGPSTAPYSSFKDSVDVSNQSGKNVHLGNYFYAASSSSNYSWVHVGRVDKTSTGFSLGDYVFMNRGVSAFVIDESAVTEKSFSGTNDGLVSKVTIGCALTKHLFNDYAGEIILNNAAEVSGDFLDGWLGHYLTLKGVPTISSNLMWPTDLLRIDVEAEGVDYSKLIPNSGEHSKVKITTDYLSDVNIPMRSIEGNQYQVYGANSTLPGELTCTLDDSDIVINDLSGDYQHHDIVYLVGNGISMDMSDYYTVAGKSITLLKDGFKHVPSGEYTLYVGEKRSRIDAVRFKFTNNVYEPFTSNMPVQSETFNATSADDVSYVCNLTSPIDSVKLDTHIFTGWESSIGLVFKKDSLGKLPNGTFNITVILEDGTELTGSTLTVKNSSITDEAPSMIVQEKIFDYSNPADIEFTCSLGGGFQAADSITSVTLNGATSTFTYDAGKIIFSAEYLKTLVVDDYAVTVTLSDGTVFTGSKLTTVGDFVPPTEFIVDKLGTVTLIDGVMIIPSVSAGVRLSGELPWDVYDEYITEIHVLPGEYAPADLIKSLFATDSTLFPKLKIVNIQSSEVKFAGTGYKLNSSNTAYPTGCSFGKLPVNIEELIIPNLTQYNSKSPGLVRTGGHNNIVKLDIGCITDDYSSSGVPYVTKSKYETFWKTQWPSLKDLTIRGVIPYYNEMRLDLTNQERVVLGGAKYYSSSSSSAKVYIKSPSEYIKCGSGFQSVSTCKVIDASCYVSSNNSDIVILRTSHDTSSYVNTKLSKVFLMNTSSSSAITADNLYWLDDNTYDGFDLSNIGKFYGYSDSGMKEVCKKNNVEFVELTDFLGFSNDRLSYDMKQAEPLTINIGYGYNLDVDDVDNYETLGECAKETVVSLKINGIEMLDSSVHSSSVTIPVSKLSKIPNGTHITTLEYDDHTTDTCLFTMYNNDGVSANTMLQQITRLFDASAPKNAEFKVSLGLGDTGADSITSVVVDSTKLSEDCYEINSDSTLLTVKSSYLSTLDNGRHAVQVLFSNGDLRDGAYVTVINAGDSFGPSMEKQAKKFDASKPEDLTFTYSLGTGSKAAQSITSIVLGDRELNIVPLDTEFTIPSSELMLYGNGTHPVRVTFDNGVTVSNSSVNVINSTVVTPVNPSIEFVQKIFDYTNASDIAFTVNLGAGASTATSVTDVLIDNESIEFTSDVTSVTVPSTYLESLINGVYQVSVEFDTGYIAEGASIKVINKPVPIQRNPSIEHQQKVFDTNSSTDISFIYDLGGADLAATSIHRVFLGDVQVDYTADGSSFTLSKDLFTNLTNGVYQVTVEFDNYFEAKGSSVRVINAHEDKPVTGKPPVVLTTMVYEFYKDSPRDVVIPVEFNDATSLSKLRVGSVDLEPTDWDIEEGAIILLADYLETLEVDTYRVIPTFNDASKTVATNLKLKVYDSPEDREFPYLLYDRIIYDESDLDLIWSEGYGSSEASDVLALQIDGKLVLQNGKTIPFSRSAVERLKKEYNSENLPIATPSNATKLDIYGIATPNNAVIKVLPRNIVMATARAFTGDAYTVTANRIRVNSEFIDSMGLSKGEHLIGAVFNNTETTTDLCKVILTMEHDLHGIDKPNEDDKPSTGDKPSGTDKPSTDDKPSTGDKPSGGSSGSSSGGNSGGSSSGGWSGGGSGSSIKSDPSKNPDGSWNSKYSPSIIGLKFGKLSISSDGQTIMLDEDGNVAYNKWIHNGIGWYRTDEKAQLRYGWFLDSDKWYMLDRTTGLMRTGWYYEPQDTKWYFLSPVDGHMLTGWQAVDYKWYYFTVQASGQTYFGDNVNGWTFNINDKTARPYGSMYCNEITPDNYKVDSSGAWVK